MATTLPLVNGNYYSYANIEFRVGSILIVGCKSINYGHKVGSQFVRGTNQMPLGTTLGQYEPHADVELYRPQYDTLISALTAQSGGRGYFTVRFNVTVTYGNFLDNGGLPTVTDSINYAQIIDDDASNTESLDASVRKLVLLPLQILMNKNPGINTLPVAGAIG